ncbi:hypothetical protein [Pontibacter chitinilyticus]|uniref:hypothetical protein n=1 Tax=Pontibacter chitinilyticus TaxID=2674989 RepID=UPI003D2CDA91
MQITGTVLSIRGSVVDAVFEAGIPHINMLLRTGQEQRILLEVLTQLSTSRARCIALTPTQGLALGAQVQTTGGPLQAPVGRETLGRMLNVFGETIAGTPAPAENTLARPSFCREAGREAAGGRHGGRLLNLPAQPARLHRRTGAGDTALRVCNGGRSICSPGRRCAD